MTLRLAQLVFFSIALGGASQAQEKSKARPEAMTPEKFERLHKLIKPQPDEWRWAQIPWVLTLSEARKKAAQEGKPVFVWTMAGEPLGQC